MTALIEVRDLHKRFGRRTVVAGLSFEIPRGSVVAFLGPNGAGKSTTLRILAGYLAPDGGTAAVAGHDVRTAPLRARAALGYLPEAAAGFSNLTVREFLTFAGESRGLWSGECRDAVERAAHAVDLVGALDRTLGALSKGLRQRAWFAQAILHDPAVLVLDEPTDGLDPNQKIQLRRFIASIAADKAVLMSTHILEEAEAICDRAIIIAGGKLLADAPLRELTDTRGHLAETFARVTAPAGGTAGPC